MVQCNWAAPETASIPDVLDNWALLTEPGEPRHDDQAAAGEIAGIAAANWRTACASLNPPVRSIAELQDAVAVNPKCSAMGMLLLTGNMVAQDDYLGICFFERTWANNVFMACLAAHPHTMRANGGCSGTGVGLIYALCEIAETINAQNLWAQTTEDSADQYKTYFSLQSVSDHFIVTSEQMIAFRTGYRAKWNLPLNPANH